MSSKSSGTVTCCWGSAVQEKAGRPHFVLGLCTPCGDTQQHWCVVLHLVHGASLPTHPCHESGEAESLWRPDAPRLSRSRVGHSGLKKRAGPWSAAGESVLHRPLNLTTSSYFDPAKSQLARPENCRLAQHAVRSRRPTSNSPVPPGPFVPQLIMPNEFRGVTENLSGHRRAAVRRDGLS